MFTADPPPIVQPSRATEQDVIEVIGSRPDQTLKIDRRTYRVNQNPHSAQKDAIQLLRGLSAVTVTPDDQIMLLGNPNVTLFVDGRRYPGNATEFLRTHHGSDIERIEIITNPSAQYSAEGTGGIINFVLRRKQGQGVSGTASVELANPRRGVGDGVIKYKRGKLTYEIEAHGSAGINSRATYEKLRSVQETPAAMPTANTEDGSNRTRQNSGSIGAKVTYELDAKTNVSAKLFAGAERFVKTSDIEFVGLTPGFQSFTERERLRNSAQFVSAEMALDHKGSKEGETLNASLQLFGNPRTRLSDAAEFSDGSALSIRHDNRLLFGRGQIDWQHPMGKGQILSVGGSWNFADTKQHYQFTSLDRDGSLGADSVDQYRAVTNTLAGYATFQLPIGSWTIMPGIRIERNGRRISSPGLPTVRIDRTDLFPTFHLNHTLSKSVDLTVSYSKRIDRASADYLRPFRVVEGVLSIAEGNPRLNDQSTDSYEINLHYRRKKLDAGVIIYDRATKGLWSRSYSVVDGVNIYTFVNAGHSRDRGAQIDVSSPILSRVKLSASVNLFQRRAPINTENGTINRQNFQYTSNTTLEWNGRDRGRTPGDVAQLQWFHIGPSRDFEFRNDASDWLSLSYTHSFSRALSLTGAVNYLGRSRNRLLAPLVDESYSQRSPVQFKLKLLKTFGNP